MQKSITVILALLIFAGGYAIGRHNTIRSVELCDITEQEYYINFNGEVHSYDY